MPWHQTPHTHPRIRHGACRTHVCSETAPKPPFPPLPSPAAHLVSAPSARRRRRCPSQPLQFALAGSGSKPGMRLMASTMARQIASCGATRPTCHTPHAAQMAQRTRQTRTHTEKKTHDSTGQHRQQHRGQDTAHDTRGASGPSRLSAFAPHSHRVCIVGMARTRPVKPLKNALAPPSAHSSAVAARRLPSQAVRGCAASGVVRSRRVSWRRAACGCVFGACGYSALRLA
eukprot:2827773-Rhodomonas_salina.2